MTLKLGVLLFVVVGVALVACKKEKPMGSCEVTYDMAGPKGDACTVVREDECVDDVQPAINIMATTKKKAFTPGGACAGYTASGCPDIPIAWSFKGQCPR